MLFNFINVVSSTDEFSAIATGWDPKSLPMPLAKLQPLIKAQVVAASLAGEIHVAEDTEKAIVGVALWFGPGREMFERRVFHHV